MDLSLAKCRIGDVGCDLLLGCLSNNPKLCVLNLSACHLTNRSAMCLSLFFKRRKADLIQNVWEQSSLQSDEENSKKEHQGLHTLILNKNPKIGDNGIRHLTCALKSDFWLKSLSLQSCGITRHGGQIILELLQDNSVITRMDLAGNYIHVNALQIILRTLKRRRETAENVPLKQRLFFGWRKVSPRNLCKRKLRGRISENGRRSMNLSEEPKKLLLRSHRLRRMQRFERGARRSKELQNMKKEDSFQSKNLRDLESQLSSIITFNSTLKEELSSNKALLETETQERSKVENELQRGSMQLNDLKSKVIMLDCLRSKVHGESELLKVLRYVFEKLEAFSTVKRHNDRDMKVEIALDDAEERLEGTSTRRRRNYEERTLPRRPYCPSKA